MVLVHIACRSTQYERAQKHRSWLRIGLVPRKQRPEVIEGNAWGAKVQQALVAQADAIEGGHDRSTESDGGGRSACTFQGGEQARKPGIGGGQKNQTAVGWSTELPYILCGKKFSGHKERATKNIHDSYKE